MQYGEERLTEIQGGAGAGGALSMSPDARMMTMMIERSSRDGLLLLITVCLSFKCRQARGVEGICRTIF